MSSLQTCGVGSVDRGAELLGIGSADGDSGVSRFAILSSRSEWRLHAPVGRDLGHEAVRGERRGQAWEMRCFHSLPNIDHRDESSVGLEPTRARRFSWSSRGTTGGRPRPRSPRGCQHWSDGPMCQRAGPQIRVRERGAARRCHISPMEDSDGKRRNREAGGAGGVRDRHARSTRGTRRSKARPQSGPGPHHPCVARGKRCTPRHRASRRPAPGLITAWVPTSIKLEAGSCSGSWPGGPHACRGSAAPWRTRWR